jgi:hypothetical protein
MPIRQVPTTTKGSQWALNSKAFGEGFREAKNGLPLDYDKYRTKPDDQWNYERGRLFAHVFDGELKYGKKINRQALWALGNAIRSHLIL